MATIAATAALAGSAFADANQEYIKTFGMIMYERTGLTDLKLTPEEFDVFMAGMKDAYAGKKLPANIAEIGQKMGAYLQARAEANIAEEAKKTEAKAAEYWKELEKKEGLNKTPTGLAYEIIEKGTGEFPKENSTVKVLYTGKLIDGTVFDSTDKVGKPAEFNLQGVIPGFREGLQKVAKGGKARLYIPAKLGYGTQQLPGIPANSTLIFDVEIVDIDNSAPKAPAAVQ